MSASDAQPSWSSHTVPRMPLREDIIGQDESTGRPRQPRHAKCIAAVMAGLAAGAITGSLLTAQLRQEEPGPARAFAFAGPPRHSPEEVVVPIEVSNAGTAPFRVSDVRRPGGVEAGLTFALRTDGVAVPAGEARTVHINVRRDCQTNDRRTAARPELDIAIQANDAATMQHVPIFGFAAQLPGVLPCEG